MIHYFFARALTQALEPLLIRVVGDYAKAFGTENGRVADCWS